MRLPWQEKHQTARDTLETQISELKATLRQREEAFLVLQARLDKLAQIKDPSLSIRKVQTVSIDSTTFSSMKDQERMAAQEKAIATLTRHQEALLQGIREAQNALRISTIQSSSLSLELQTVQKTSSLKIAEFERQHEDHLVKIKGLKQDGQYLSKMLETERIEIRQRTSFFEAEKKKLTLQIAKLQEEKTQLTVTLQTLRTLPPPMAPALMVHSKSSSTTLEESVRVTPAPTIAPIDSRSLSLFSSRISTEIQEISAKIETLSVQTQDIQEQQRLQSYQSALLTQTHESTRGVQASVSELFKRMERLEQQQARFPSLLPLQLAESFSQTLQSLGFWDLKKTTIALTQHIDRLTKRLKTSGMISTPRTGSEALSATPSSSSSLLLGATLSNSTATLSETHVGLNAGSISGSDSDLQENSSY